MENTIVIVGGGLAGCILGFTLSEKYEQKVLLIDDNHQRCASAVAAGIFNPITGKRMAKTWLADAIFPAMFTFYKRAEQVLHKKFIYQHSVVKPFDTIKEQNEGIAKTADTEYKDYIRLATEYLDLAGVVDYPLGGITVDNSGWLDCNSFMQAVKSYFVNKNQYQEGKYVFDSNEIVKEGNLIKIPLNSKIVNCAGFQASLHPVWANLPWQLAKGEIVTVKSQVKLHNVINKTVFLCPTPIANEYKCGATYIWNTIDNAASQNGTDELTQKLTSFFRVKFDIIKTEAEVRPTVKNRKPFLGNHPSYPNEYIFNGFGSKTVSMAPYFAIHFCEFLLGNSNLMAEVNVNQHFDKLLTRK